MSLNVNYLGLDLKSPVVVASSPFTNSADKIVKLEEHGAGAVVLKSVFEEQIMGEAAFLQRYNDYAEAAAYLNEYVTGDQLRGHLNLVSEAKKRTSIPVIASINCQSKGRWTDYAKSLESAGADALELNIFILPTDASKSSADIEELYLDVIESVTSQLKIPVSIKLGVRFTNVLHLATEIYYRKAKGVVMFNRFFEPDIDVDNMSIVGADVLSSRSELRNNLRTVALCAAEVPTLDIAVSTGVHTGEDVVKSLLAGAKVTQVCTTLYNGLDRIGEMNSYIEKWMVEHTCKTIDEFRGRLSYLHEHEETYQRVQYMKFFPKG